MKNLIVNADDLGWTAGVNRGIAEAHRNGIVTSTSLLANGNEPCRVWLTKKANSPAGPNNCY